MMERQHGVRLAAAEIGLKPDDRLPAPAGEACNRRGQDAPQALRRIGDSEERGRITVLLSTITLVDQRQVGRELGIGEARFEHVRMGLADLAPGTEPFRRWGLLEREGRRCRGGLASARRALRLVQSFDDRDLRRGTDGRQQFAHGVEVAKRLARSHVSCKVRRAVAGVQRQRDEAPRLAQVRVVAEEIAPLIEQGLQEGIDVQLSSGFVPACPARVVAPVRAMAVAHVFGDIGSEPDAERFQTLFDSLLGRTGSFGLAGISCSRRFLHVDQLDPLSVAPEILDVQRQQPALAVRQHGGRNVGIVNLLPRDRNLSAERDQRRHDVRAILEHGERRYQPRCVRECVVDGERCRPGLRAGDGNKVLADDLAADVQGFTAVADAVEVATGGDMSGGGHNTRCHENVRVDEHAGQWSLPVVFSGPPVRRPMSS